MNTEIRRDSYLDQLLLRRNNGLIKVVWDCAALENPTCSGRCSRIIC